MTTAFGKNLRALRERKNLSQRELAKLVDVNNATISSYENSGQYPQKQRIKEKLQSVLECSEVDLFGYSDGYFNKQISGLRIQKQISSEKDTDINERIKTYINKPFTENMFYDIINPSNKECQIQHSYLIEDDRMDKIMPQGSLVYFNSEKNLEDCINHITLINIDGKNTIGRLHKIENIEAYILSPESNNSEQQIIQISKDSDYKVLGIAKSFTYKGALL